MPPVPPGGIGGPAIAGFLFRNLRDLLACHAVVVLVKAGAIRRLSGRATERQARRAARTKAVRSVSARPSDMLSAEDATQIGSVFVTELILSAVSQM